ncbi:MULTISPECIES: DUF4269 domain-containing protein [unclassified Pedobacter]|uniref:DUF4269 domain-containing protein n=1 Tax=unclassified Pedobacter TaxID=2628915 RepID=UPI00141E30E1|nr:MULTISPECIES: DUF4269 domain-containing protein [unclassified Pedobacter]NII82739.1 putative nucleotidyltransferase [Pedobacter sp. SG908]NMN36757.1 putative nucleotidyltransferase [Pedobacter sp. SG918]
MAEFNNIDYLQTGSIRQQQLYKTLEKSGLLDLLRAYDPIVVGSIPLGLDLPDSDVDIICSYADKLKFQNYLKAVFGEKVGFVTSQSAIYANETITANFREDNFEFEIFGQQIPTRDQMGYKHLLIEDHLLMTHGQTFKNQICELKEDGYRTEEAFCKLLGINGNPYIALIEQYEQVLHQHDI